MKVPNIKGVNPQPSKLPQDALEKFVGQLLSVLQAAPAGSMGPTPGQVNALATIYASFVDASEAVVPAKAAYQNVLKTRDTQMSACAGVSSTIVGILLANPNLTPGQLASMGLQARSRTPTKIVPRAVAGLNLALLPTGEVALSWTRSGNPGGVVFRVEARVDSEPWTFVDETTATKMTLSGFEAGVSASFRIVASKNGILAPASPVALAYPEPSAPALRIAA